MIEIIKGKISSKNKPFLNHHGELQQYVYIITEGSNKSVKITLFGQRLISKLQLYKTNEEVTLLIIKRPAFNHRGTPITYINVKEIIGATEQVKDKARVA